MPELLKAEFTTFTLDTMGRFLANTLGEAVDSSTRTVGDAPRAFDVIVLGGGSFGSVVAERLLLNDTTHDRRILVLEAGPFVLPEHAQNLPFMGGAPDMRTPWVADTAQSLANGRKPLGYAGLIYAIGGRSLTWGGWSPQLLDAEMKDWPPAVVSELKADYFKQSSDQIGVDETNDFIYGRLHTGLRRRLFDGLKATGPAIGAAPFSELPDHPAVQYADPAELTDDVLKAWLGLPSTDPTPSADLRSLFKLEAPLAVQSQTLPGLFPFNKFSAVPLLVRASRIAQTETDGVGPEADSRKRVMVVASCRVLDLVTETQSDDWVRVTGVRVRDRDGAIQVIPLAPPRPDGRQGVVVIALGTIESARLALNTFKDSLGWRAAQRMGRNLMAHLRSNLTIRVPVGALGLPPATSKALQASALFVKGKTTVDGVDRYFHLQITASGASSLGADAEAELFKKIPDIEHVSAMLRADDTHVVITLRGIGEMAPRNPDSTVQLARFDSESGRPAAYVEIGDANGNTPGASAQTLVDRQVWAAMDRFTDQIALLFANGQPFEILGKAGELTIPVPAGASAADLALYFEHPRRHDLLGTTHHDAGTLWMGTDPATSVTNEYGRIHDTTNCYVASPALFPAVGSPNPMLTGVALARRTADLLHDKVLARSAVSAVEAGWTALFDGTEASLNRWKTAGRGGQGFVLVNGELVSYGGNDIALLWYAKEAFDNFTLRLRFRVFDRDRHNSGVFVRFRNPLSPVAPVIRARAQANQDPIDDNPALRAVYSGFEVQIDDAGRGDSRKDFYGVRPEPDGLRKNRTGAIYKIPAGDFIAHQNRHDAAWQQYTPGPALVPGRLFEYEIKVSGDTYAVTLADLSTGAKQQTTTYDNADKERGLATLAGQPAGHVGLQSYPGQVVAFSNVRIKKGG
jgi:choline dehydrogenase-like flavoprotein